MRRSSSLAWLLRGIVVQLGLSGSELTLPFNTVVAKEFDLRGAFRFHEEFAVAVQLINQQLVDLKPLISATLPYRDAGRASRSPPTVASDEGPAGFE